MRDPSPKPGGRSGAARRAWRALGSLRLGILLLVLIALASIIGIGLLEQPQWFRPQPFLERRLDPASPDALRADEIAALARMAGVLSRGETADAFAKRAQRGEVTNLEHVLRLFYIHSYGRTLGRLFLLAGFHTIFSSLWFRLLCFLLVVNITACSTQRLRAQWRAAFGLRASHDPAWYGKRAVHASLAGGSGIGGTADAVERALRGHGFFIRRGPAREVVTLEGSRSPLAILGRLWRPLGVLAGLGRLGSQVVHLGVVLIVIGGFVSGRLSFRHHQLAAPGDVLVVPDVSYRLSLRYQLSQLWHELRRFFDRTFEPPKTRAELAAQADWRQGVNPPPPTTAFRLGLRRFEARFDLRGKPEHYGAHVTLLDSNPPIDQVIEVNRPLVYRGFYAYQESYRPTRRIASVRFVVDRVRRQGAASEHFHGRGKPAEVLRRSRADAPLNTDVVVPGTDLTLRVLRYFSHWRIPLWRTAEGRLAAGESRNDAREFNPAIQVRLEAPGQEPRLRWVPLPKPPPHGRGTPRGNIDYGDLRITPVDFDPKYDTWLAFKTHPVMLPVWVGCGVMMLGILLCFYCNHERIWALVRPTADGGSEVLLAGNAFKWRQKFRERFAAIVCSLAEQRERQA